MIQPLKLYFDNCCSDRLPVELRLIYSPAHPTLETRHLKQDELPSTADRDWLGKIQRQGWVVITCDRGQDRKTYPLPLACKELGITHVAFSPKLLTKGFQAQKHALMAVWDELFLLDRYPAGTQVRLGEDGVTKDGEIRYALKVVPPRTGE